MIYKEAINYIKNIERCGSDFGIERMRVLLDLMGSPDDSLRFIHIAGTNGKGSTSCYITHILMHCGYKVGTYNSPSVFGYNERFLINGKPISDDDVSLYLTTVKDVIEKKQQELIESGSESTFTPTAFEIETAVAMSCFYAEKCDICVIETGMGGRWDATNAIRQKELAIITPIGLDHCDILGNTLGEIASEKAAISKDILVTVPQCEEIMEQLRHPYNVISGEKVAIKNHVIVAEKPELISSDINGQEFKYKGKTYRIKMLGLHQLENASLAIEAVKNLCRCVWDVPEKAICEGLLEANLGGRFEVINNSNNRFNIPIKDGKLLVLDGSHNPQGADTLAQCINEYLKNKSICLVYGMFKDKDCEGVASKICPLADKVITVQAPGPRGIDYLELKGIASKYCGDVDAIKNIREGVLEGLKKSDVTILCGSFSLMGLLGE